MILIIRICLISLFLLPFAIIARAEGSPLKLTISLAQKSVRVGDPIELDLFFSNLTNENILIPRQNNQTQAERSTHIVVEKANGGGVPLTEYGRNLYELNSHNATMAVPLRPTMALIKPGGSNKDVAILNNTYIIDRPGVYYVNAEYTLPNYMGKKTILSNTVKLTIIP